MVCPARRFLSEPKLSDSDRDNDGGDHAVEAKYLSEDQNEDKSDKDGLIDGVKFDTYLTDQADSVASRNVGESTEESCAQVKEWESWSW